MPTYKYMGSVRMCEKSEKKEIEKIVFVQVMNLVRV